MCSGLQSFAKGLVVMKILLSFLFSGISNSSDPKPDLYEPYGRNRSPPKPFARQVMFKKLNIR